MDHLSLDQSVSNNQEIRQALISMPFRLHEETESTFFSCATCGKQAIASMPSFRKGFKTSVLTSG